MVTEKKIGVLMGGASAEREVSLKSGRAVFKALQSKGYRAVAIDVGGDICEVLRREGIELAFLTLHGGYGENGALQGLLEILGIPYTGSGVLASALAMDKESAKKIFRYHAIPAPPFTVIGRSQCPALHEVPVDFPLPWVVKPAAEGSSIGVSIVREERSLAQALEQALTLCERAIVEQYIAGTEVQVAVLNGTVLGAVEVRTKQEFYTYEAKYTQGLTEYILPPEVEPGILENAAGAALSAHRVLGCRGATRVDLIIDGTGDPYVLEVNTIPGMTETSLLPKIAAMSGLDFPSLIEEIMREAITGGREK